jgi:phosphoadenosine phosphosulfate reductase
MIDARVLSAVAHDLARALANLSAGSRLAQLRRDVHGVIVFTTSFGLEDQVILHLLHERNLNIDVVTLDTGRLFPETYALWAESERRYGRRIRAFYPRHERLSDLIDDYGINGFYGSRPARLSCCQVRKVEPLRRALAGADAWITGLRAEQSAQRAGIQLASPEPDHRLVKVNPLLDWSRQAVSEFVRANNVPVNPLHDRGFASIGCAPCTRAIGPGESERAGRWWWEDDTKKECGLHVKAQASLPARLASGSQPMPYANDSVDAERPAATGGSSFSTSQ